MPTYPKGCWLEWEEAGVEHFCKIPGPHATHRCANDNCEASYKPPAPWRAEAVSQTVGGKRIREKPVLDKDDYRHGTLTGYKLAGCHCQPCQIVGEDYRKRRREQASALRAGRAAIAAKEAALAGAQQQ